MNDLRQGWKAFLKIWKSLIAPSPGVVGVEAIHRARGVAAILLVTCVISAALVLVEAPLTAVINIRVPLLLCLIFSYGLARTRWYKLGGTFASIVLAASPVLLLLLDVEHSLAWQVFAVRGMIVALLLTYVLYKLKCVYLFAVGYLIATIAASMITGANIDIMALTGDVLFSCGAFFFMLFISREFTFIDRLEAQEELQASESRYRAIVEDQSELICRWIPQTRVLTFVNGAYQRYFAGTDEILIGTDFMGDVYPDDVLIVENSIAGITQDNPTITYEHRILDRVGDTRWMHWTDHGIFDLDGTLIEVQSVGRDVTESKAAEVRLRASEARYRAVIEDQTELICRWLPDETTTFVNNAYCRYMKRSAEDLIGASILSMIYPDDVALVRAKVAELSLYQPTVTYVHRIVGEDGEFRWMEWTDRAIFDDAGEIVEFQSVGRDVTELKKVEEAEREQRKFAEALQANAAVISATLDLDEVLDHILRHIATAFPFVSADVMLLEDGLARVMRSTGHVDEAYKTLVQSMRLRAHEIPNLRHMITTGLPVLIADTHQTTEWADIPASRWIRAAIGAPIRLEDETIGFLSLNSDKPNAFSAKHAQRLSAFADQAATAIRNARLYDAVRRHAEEMESQVTERTAELALVTRRLSAIFDSTGEGIFYTEGEIIQYVNPTFCKMVGCAPDQLIGRNMGMLYGENDEAAQKQIAHFPDVIRDVGIWRGEIVMRRLDGKEFDAGLTISPIGSIDDDPMRAVTIVRDISQEKALEAQRSNLLAFASHELRTPITNLKTRLYLLKRLPETLPEHLPVLNGVAERMHQLVDQLLDMSRLERGLVEIECSPMDVRGLIEEIALVQRGESDRRGLRLLVELPAEPLVVNIDSLRMFQVITNLVSNAINYTSEGGSVTVSAKRTGDVALVAVSDTGIGIAPEHLSHIFEPFFRVASKVEGTGLGLSIVKEIVHLHKGEISVQSELNHGSRFILRLPLYTEPKLLPPGRH